MFFPYTRKDNLAVLNGIVLAGILECSKSSRVLSNFSREKKGDRISIPTAEDEIRYNPRASMWLSEDVAMPQPKNEYILAVESH